MADTPRGRPGQETAPQDDAQGDGISHRLQRQCPLVRAALYLGDPAVLAVVARIHPALCCPAARRERKP